MEEDTTKDIMYSCLPACVETHSTQLGFTPNFTKTKEEEFILAFMKKSVPKQYLQKDINDTILRYKNVRLDKNQKEKQKKSSFKPFKRKTISNKERKSLKLFQLKKEGHRYSDYVRLQSLWQEYIQEVIHFTKLNEKNMHTARESFLKADLHGAILTVERSLCPSYVGTTGIVLQESRNTFKIITKQNKLKTIPKLNSVFTTHVCGYIFTIHGNHFRVKTFERASKKFKRKSTTDL